MSHTAAGGPAAGASGGGLPVPVGEQDQRQLAALMAQYHRDLATVVQTSGEITTNRAATYRSEDAMEKAADALALSQGLLQDFLTSLCRGLGAGMAEQLGEIAVGEGQDVDLSILLTKPESVRFFLGAELDPAGFGLDHSVEV